MKAGVSTFAVILLLLMSSLLMLPQRGTAEPEGLVGYWKFDEGSGTIAADSSGKSNTGTLQNGPAWVNGKVGKALDFDGVDDFVLVEDSPTLHLSSGVTVESWIFLPSGADYSDFGKILSKAASNGGTNLDFGIWDNEGHVDFGVGYGGGYPGEAIIVYSVGTVSRDVWTHVAATYDGSLLKIYFNGALDSTNSFTSGINTDNGRPLTIGKGNFFPWSNEFWLDGMIDDARLYNRALSQQEIIADMNGGSWPQGDLWIESIRPVQTLINPSVMITGKPTVFEVTVVSTFADRMSGVYLLIACGTQSWYNGPYSIGENQRTIIYTGGDQAGGQCYCPPGEFDVEITVDAFNKIKEDDESNNTLPEHIDSFKQLGRMKILYVPTGFWNSLLPGLATDPGILDSDMREEVRFSGSFVKAAFPIDPTLYQSETAAEVAMLAPYLQDDYGRRLEARLRMIQMEMDLKKYHQPSMGGYDRIIAVVPHRQASTWLGYWWGEEAYGMTLQIPYETVSWVEEGYWATPAHELWHSYTGSSEHCTNYGGQGYWDPSHLGLVSAPCLMKTGDEIYHGKSDQNSNIMAVYQWICPQCYARLTDLSSFAFCDDPEILFVSGLVFTNDTVDLNPFYHFAEGYAELGPATTGNYTLRFLDNNQQLLDSFGFNVTFDSEFDFAGFGFAVPFQDGAAHIQVVHNGTAIAARDISSNSPIVSVISPGNGGVLTSGQNITVEWEGTDADNDALSYTVLYTPDNGYSWIPIQTGVTQTSLNWTVPNDHPTNQCRIKVVASDGVNTGEGLSSGVFAVLRHDVGVRDFEISKSAVGEGYSLPVNATIQNNGNFTEEVSLQVYANTTIIYMTSFGLEAGASASISFSWGTSGYTKGSYVITAYTVPVLDEVDMTDNNMTGSWVLVTLAGDFDGNRRIDIFDIVRMAGVYGLRRPNLGFVPNCDIDGDGDIDIFDVVIAAGNYGKSW